MSNVHTCASESLRTTKANVQRSKQRKENVNKLLELIGSGLLDYRTDEQISSMIGVGARQVRRYLKELSEGGIITICTHRGVRYAVFRTMEVNECNTQK